MREITSLLTVNAIFEDEHFDGRHNKQNIGYLFHPRRNSVRSNQETFVLCDDYDERALFKTSLHPFLIAVFY